MTTLNGKKTAVLLCGLNRTANLTCGSFNDHVSDYLDADVFYCGYKYSDKPTNIHQGIYDKFGYIKDNPKNTCKFDPGDEITYDTLSAAYGNRLIGCVLHDNDIGYFSDAISFISRREYLFDLNPGRFLSMFFNIQECFKIMQTHEEKNNFKYDYIVVTRPDLAFYADLDITLLAPKHMVIPSGMGFCPHTGNLNKGLVQPLFYKNVFDGTCIYTGNQFSDQIMVLNRDDCDSLSTLVDSMIFYMKKRVPLTPETLLYYHFHCVHKLIIDIDNSWIYEIFRVGASEIVNITDLMMLERYDPHHEIVQERAKKQKIKYFFKGIRNNYYYYKGLFYRLVRN